VEFVFGDQILDVDRREFRRNGALIALEPQVFDLLVYLVQNRDRVISKDDLLTAIWGGRIVSESTFSSRAINNWTRSTCVRSWRNSCPRDQR
jgi:DNA-binding winged helix-turn-helix (wHTH) protein